MRKTWIILKEGLLLVRRNKAWFLAPILISLALLALLVFALGPAAVISFLYAGI